MARAATYKKKSRAIDLPIRVLVIAQVFLLLGYFAYGPAEAYASELYLPQSVSSQDTSEGEGAGREAPDSEPIADSEVYSFSAQDLIDAQTNQSNYQHEIIIPYTEVPLASPFEANQTMGFGGSLINTSLAVICIITMAAMLILLLTRKTSDYRVMTVRTLAVTFGLVMVVIWALFDRLQLPSTTLNDSSALIVAFFCVYLSVALFSYFYERQINKKRAIRR
ncbi:MAG: hypothetical protein FWD27_03385 [Coriobacteriia bacterium]|nr:hypothetical protein [Coriobacteriia bacterium]